MLQPGRSYDEVCRAFNWCIPARYNIGVDVCDKHVTDGNRLALIYEDGAGRIETYGFARLRELSNRFANALAASGIGRGDRVGILLPQCPEAAVAHVAVYKLGAIAVPLFTLFGPDALEYRLGDSGARALITDAASLDKVLPLRDRLPGLATLIATGGRGAGAEDFDTLVDKGSAHFKPADTGPDDPALIIYTSGTTGPPKGALHAHRVVLGHLPGVQFPHDFFPQPGDRFWTPADWAWIGGLIDVLLPAWHFGVPVLAHRMRKFDPERAFDLMARHGVRNAFLPPTALKLMRQVEAPRARHDVRLRSVGSGGETLGEELLAWGTETLGVTINEFYGQTEANLVLGNCAAVMPVRPGSMGRAVPGHRVAIVDEAGARLPAGEVGQVAVRRPDPVMFLEYWRNAAATRAKFAGEWCLTGDLARRDDSGYFWFVGRQDDVITSAGYRIGPSEVEDCLMKHSAVAMAAVVGKPDPLRTEIVKAFVVVKPGVAPSDALAGDIQAFVRDRLAAHEYPREVAFVDELPMTATGKIMRRVLRERDGQGNSTPRGAGRNLRAIPGGIRRS
jgi:acetyl-CoA synthetase